jgi:hypothetical protein
MRTAPARLGRLTALALIAACVVDSPTESGQPALEPRAHSFANSEWSAPVNLGPVVNSAANDNAPALSKDELSLYFLSDRPGGFGGQDIWAARRDCVDCPWQPPTNLGAAINTAANEGGPDLSLDGHLLFFVSNRPGGAGMSDIYVSRRADPKDDHGWGPPMRLGPDVNTPDAEAGPDYLQSAEDGPPNLYFNRGALPPLAADIYVAPVTRDGATRGRAILVEELSAPMANDANANVRTDGREIYFWSFGPGRPDAQLGDLYVSTRRSVHDSWSAPRRLGSPLNTAFNEISPDLSFDGRTLLLVSDRPGGVGLFDIYMSTRTPSGR